MKTESVKKNKIFVKIKKNITLYVLKTKIITVYKKKHSILLNMWEFKRAWLTW